MTDTFPTMGEALVRRMLEKHKRSGVDHYVTGQLDGFVADPAEKVIYITYVDQMGHAVNIPYERAEGEWKPVGVYQRAGQATAEPLSKVSESFTPPPEHLAVLDRLATEAGL